MGWCLGTSLESCRNNISGGLPLGTWVTLLRHSWPLLVSLPVPSTDSPWPLDVSGTKTRPVQWEIPMATQGTLFPYPLLTPGRRKLPPHLCPMPRERPRHPAGPTPLIHATFCMALCPSMPQREHCPQAGDSFPPCSTQEQSEQATDAIPRLFMRTRG